WVVLLGFFFKILQIFFHLFGEFFHHIFLLLLAFEKFLQFFTVIPIEVFFFYSHTRKFIDLLFHLVHLLKRFVQALDVFFLFLQLLFLQFALRKLSVGIHRRFSAFGPVNTIVVKHLKIVRIFFSFFQRKFAGKCIQKLVESPRI